MLKQRCHSMIHKILSQHLYRLSSRLFAYPIPMAGHCPGTGGFAIR